MSSEPELPAEQAEQPGQAENAEQAHLPAQRAESVNAEGEGGNKSSRSASSSNKGDKSRKEKKRYKYCCRNCKHTKQGRKTCVCVVPKSQRRMLIGENGCRTCFCHGCSIEDFIARGEDPEYKPRREEEGRRREKRSRSRSKDRRRGHAPQEEGEDLPFNNLDSSAVGQLIRDSGVNPLLIGYGIPQRTKSYIFGRP